MVTFTSIAPIFPVSDIHAAIEHYRRLGFAVEAYGGAEPYAFADCGPVQLHLSQVHDIDRERSQVSAYLYVDDADELAECWAQSGASGRFIAPTDAVYGLREGAHIDPDGNLIRYGSPLAR